MDEHDAPRNERPATVGDPEARRRHHLRVTGIVQGVGFRPFGHRLALELGLCGAIGNDAEGVWCEIEGPEARLAEYERRLQLEAPPLASITSLSIREVAPTDQPDFVIVDSAAAVSGGADMVPPDVAPCTFCLAEIADPTDRRHRYMFTCCTDCGPRFTVIQSLPYDRERTAMAEFGLCAACGSEYSSPDDRRFHAQATCCPECGPALELFAFDDAAEAPKAADPLERSIALLLGGACLGVKGLGGYQLLCRADDSQAVMRLRTRKHRDEKPFALLVGAVADAHRLVELDEIGERALSGPEAPIVLATARPLAPVAGEVAPGTGLLGVMLPATPLHAALVAGVGVPLVCTSGNISHHPIIINDDDAQTQLSPIADALLTHDREIVRRADDSVGQVVHGRFQLLRRARGFAPRPVALIGGGPIVLGVGAELKNTICLARDRRAAVSVHLGDLENPSTLEAFEGTIADQLTMAGVVPDLIVHDLHPEYLSTKFAAAQDLAPTLGVQHHHAHLASCLADNGYGGQAIGVIFDGLGWGANDTAWGGEFLVGDAGGYDRVAHLANVALPGGDTAARQPWRMAVAHLLNAFGDELPDLAILERHSNELGVVVDACRSPDTQRTSSIGRLFDAIAALCNVRDVASYEGQAAIGLEQSAAGHEEAGYPWDLGDNISGGIDAAALIRAVVADLGSGVSPAVVAGRFHTSVASMVTHVCVTLRARTGLATVALSGGVFQNRLLVEMVTPMLSNDGFTVLRHAQVPPNDGGISLGQVAIGRAIYALTR